MGKSLPETCWADHWRSIKLLLLHLVGFYITLPTLMMHGQTQIKFTITGSRVWNFIASYFASTSDVHITVILPFTKTGSYRHGTGVTYRGPKFLLHFMGNQISSNWRKTLQSLKLGLVIPCIGAHCPTPQNVIGWWSHGGYIRYQLTSSVPLQ